MSQNDSVIAVFSDHKTAEAAVKKLAEAGITMGNLSIVGKGYHTDEKVIGFYNMGDRIKFWGANGALWGGLWGWLTGSVFITVPVIGPVVVLGYLATMVVAAIEGAVVVGGVSALGAALYGAGIPKDSVVTYETALKADEFLILARGAAADVQRAKAILDTFKPGRIDIHKQTESALPVTQVA
ncbi:hypothetical protein [Bosea sp. R86505]|uniref:hypothetical protein n=1 Tax=Bosea sp. R86505 TaxID=3101710 RepID=UPI00366DB5FE